MKPAPKPVAERYGMLTVLGYESPFGWRVRCDCGNEKHLNGNNLRSQQYVSCGCSRYQRHRALMKERHRKAKVIKNAHLQPLKHAKRGTPCWCCRNKTGTKDAVALCYVCRGAA